MVNSPGESSCTPPNDVLTLFTANSGILYFTGLRYLTNISRTAWPSPDFAGCCAPYTFSSIPVIKNLTSTVSSPSSTATGGTGATGGLQIETIMGISQVSLSSLDRFDLISFVQSGSFGAGGTGSTVGWLHVLSKTRSEIGELRRGFQDLYL